MIYDEIQEMIKNIFAARAKNISDKVVNVWAKEISMKGFTDLALKDTERELMEDDETDLTLPKVLAILYKNNRKYKEPFKKIPCEYCASSAVHWTPDARQEAAADHAIPE